MASEFVDCYEILQLSPNADLDTIHRIYRLLAQRFHPDNLESGDSEMFRLLTDAYRALANPESRAAYDVEHRHRRRLQWKIFDQSNSAQGVEAERRKRQGVLSLLYRKRVNEPADPHMALREFEDMLAVPREHLDFTLWFLKEEQCVTRTDNARFAITVKGVKLAEEMIAQRPDITPTAYLNAPRMAAVG